MLIAANYKGRQLALALGVLAGDGPIAGALAFFIAGFLGATLGWRYSFGIVRRGGRWIWERFDADGRCACRAGAGSASAGRRARGPPAGKPAAPRTAAPPWRRPSPAPRPASRRPGPCRRSWPECRG